MCIRDSYRGNVQTPGLFVLWLSSKSIVPRHLSIAQVLSQLRLPDILNVFFWEKLLLILYNTLVSVTELFAKDRKFDELLPYLTCPGTSHGIIIKNSGKVEDLVLMIAKRQTQR